MTREEAISVLKVLASFQGVMEYLEQHSVSVQDACNMAISALKQNESAEEWYKLFVEKLDEQEPCDDAISRDAVIEWLKDKDIIKLSSQEEAARRELNALPSVTQKSGKCKNCKYFEYDSVAKVDGIPLIVAHEICNKWGNGCKTSEDGYCYLFEPQESEDKE